MEFTSNKEHSDYNFSTQSTINNFDYDVNKNSIISEEINKLKNEEKAKQLSTASDLEKKLLLNNKEIINDLWLSNYPVKDNDFNLDVKDGSIIIYAKSSYFASLIGLNWVKEKEKCLNWEINRDAYDEFDNKIRNLKSLSEDKKEEILQFCENNWIDFDSIVVNWWCVVQWNSNYLVWIKDTPIVSLLSNNNRIEPTILHESQHVKFNKYCEQNGIEINWYLKILNEIIANCCNTKDEEWNINFPKVTDSMVNNENYIKVSWFDKNTYTDILNSILTDTENELKSHNLSTTMQNLVMKYKDK